MSTIKIPTERFFIESTPKQIYVKLAKAGIKGNSKLPAPYVGITGDGVMWEMFMHTTNDGKKGWMIHPSHRRIKPEFISKYMMD